MARTNASNNATAPENARNLARNPAASNSVSVAIHAWLHVTLPCPAKKSDLASTRSLLLASVNESNRR